MTEQIIRIVLALFVSLASLYLYFAGSNFLLDRLTRFRWGHADLETHHVWREKWRERIRPWIFAGPALFVLGLYLVYPVFETLRLSFFDRSGTRFVGLSNFVWAAGDQEVHQALFNNVLWLLVVPTFSTALGLLFAVLADKVRWGVVAKSLIFMPMAISMIGASVIWKFVYDFRSEGSDQIGLLNALVLALGGTPRAWITVDFWNNFFLMIVFIWIQTGFAMVILSAALRGIPEETLEAAKMDGANGFQTFFRIMVPQVTGTMLVVWTTITILVLKIFDIVLSMTNGQWDTEVLANLMFSWMFRAGDFGRGSVIALLIMAGILPIMILNIRRFQKEKE